MKNKPDVPALRVCVRLIADQARETNVGYFAIAVIKLLLILVVLSSLQIHFWVGPCLVSFKRVLDSVKALERARSAQR